MAMTTTTVTSNITENDRNPPLHFRIATPADTARLYTLVQSAYRGDESRLGWTTEADLLAGDRISPEGILAKVTHPEGAVLLATTTTTTTTDHEGTTTTSGNENGTGDEVLIACCEVLRRSASTAYFGMFAVSPRRQGGGVGKQVLARAEEHCREAWGTKRMEMWVIWSREELIAWYERRGYRRTGEEAAFPYAEMERTGGVALREDLHMVTLAKDLC
jgi:GNAT superfamily N-acetyltransferase